MIKDPKLLREFERVRIQGEPADYDRNLKIFEALFEEASALGVYPLSNPLDGIEVDIRLARALNVPISA